MSYKARTLFNLIEAINKELFLPHIQRPFVWEENQMIKLFDSLMRNYPIQTLLFWRTKEAIKARKFMNPIEEDPDLSKYYDEHISKKDKDKIFVLDGQQRLQTLYAIFHGGILKEGKIEEAYFNITSGNQAPDDGILYDLKFSSDPLSCPWFRVADLLGKYGDRNNEEIADELNDILDDLKLVEEQESIDNKRLRQKRVRRNIAQLVSLLREEKYFWFQQLDGVANKFSYEMILDIFVRTNSGGTKLDASDLMFATMMKGWDEIEERIEQATALLNSTGLQFDKTFPLKCLLVVHGRGAETSAEKFNGADGDDLINDMKNHWSRAENAFRELHDFIAGELKIYKDTIVRSYTSFIPIFDYLYYNSKPDPINRTRMRGYYYKAQLFGWYSRNTDGIVNALHSIVGRPLSIGFPLVDIKGYFLGRKYRAELEKPQLTETGLRYILLNIVYVARMGTSPFIFKSNGNLPHIDHIYPRHASQTRLGLQSWEVNHIGNYRFVGATDNIRKRAELPDSYFKRLQDHGIDISQHLLVPSFSTDPLKLVFDIPTYRKFRDERVDEIWRIVNPIVNPEKAVTVVTTTAPISSGSIP